jgi:fibronectin-binding autotransporter adhesin
MAVTRSNQRRRISQAVAAVAVMAASQHLFATSANWIGSANAIDSWANGTSWDTGFAPGNTDGNFTSTDTATFAGAPTSLSIGVDANRNIGNIVFTNTSSRFTIGSTTGTPMLLTSGGAVTLNDPITFAGTATATTQTIASPLIIDRAYSFVDNVTAVNTAGGLTITGGVTGSANGPAILTLDGANNATVTVGLAQINSIVSDGPGGSTSIIKNGTGTWELRATSTAANTYSGDTVVNAGILRFSTNAGAASVNSHIIINNGGRVRFSFNGESAGPITLVSGGVLDTSNATTTATVLPIGMGPAFTLDYTAAGAAATAFTSPFVLGGATPGAGGITLLNTSSTPQITIESTTGNINIGNAMRPILITSRGTNATADLRWQGNIVGGSATGGIQKLGAGAVQLSGTSISFAGTLEVTQGQVVGSTSAGVSNQFVGLPNLLIDGPTGDFHIQGAQTQTFATVSMSAGTISVGSATTSFLIANSYNFNVPAGSSATAGAILVDAASPSSLTVSGSGGTAFLLAADTYTGGTTINPGGILSIGNGGTNGSFAGNVTNNGSLVFNKSNIITFSGNISGTGSVTQSGINNLVLLGNNSYAGGTTINAGSATATTDGNLGATGGAITLNGGQLNTAGPVASARNIVLTAAGGSVNLASANGFSTNGTATGPGLLTKLGAGALSLSSFNLGAINVSAGSVVLAANGTSAGVTSALTIGDNSAGTLAKLDLNDNDLIVKYSGSSPSATVRTLLIAGYNQGAWNGNGITSTSAQSHPGQALGYGDAADLGITSVDGNAITGNAVIVKYTYYGDSSLDGKVDLGNDFNLFLEGFLTAGGNSGSWDLGDYNYDGVTDMTDFGLFIDGIKSQGTPLGQLDDAIAASPLLSVSQKSQLLAVVPEPSSIAIIGLAACGLASRRRRA